MTPDRKRIITIHALMYIADHMEAVLDADPGPHDLVEADVEDAFLVKTFKREADKIRKRADRLRKSRRI